MAEDPTRTEVVEKALHSLDRAQISTIHSFAQALLRSFAAGAGGDPAFTAPDAGMGGGGAGAGPGRDRDSRRGARRGAGAGRPARAGRGAERRGGAGVAAGRAATCR